MRSEYRLLRERSQKLINLSSKTRWTLPAENGERHSEEPDIEYNRPFEEHVWRAPAAFICQVEYSPPLALSTCLTRTLQSLPLVQLFYRQKVLVIPSLTDWALPRQ
jgi:hypothetical protein